MNASCVPSTPLAYSSSFCWPLIVSFSFVSFDDSTPPRRHPQRECAGGSATCCYSKLRHTETDTVQLPGVMRCAVTQNDAAPKLYAMLGFARYSFAVTQNDAAPKREEGLRGRGERFAVTPKDAAPKPFGRLQAEDMVLLLPRMTLHQNYMTKRLNRLHVLLLPRMTLHQNPVTASSAGARFCCYPE